MVPDMRSLDVTIAGDDEPIPTMQRAWFLDSLAADTAEAQLRALVGLAGRSPSRMTSPELASNSCFGEESAVSRQLVLVTTTELTGVLLSRSVGVVTPLPQVPLSTAACLWPWR